MIKNLTVFLTALLSCLLFSTVAKSENAINLGIKPDKRMLARIKNNPNFKEHLTIPLEDGYALFYEETKPEILYLSIFRDGKETILWELQNGGPIMSLLVPRPVLATMKINSNDSLDLIFIYSTDFGIGKYAESWEREILIFFDGKGHAKKILIQNA